MKQQLTKFVTDVYHKFKKVCIYTLAIYVLASAAFLATGTYLSRHLLSSYHRIKQDEARLVEDVQVGKFAIAAMNLTNSKLTEYQKQTLAQAIVRVTGDILVTYENRVRFVTLISNESAFNRNATSPVGAIGLTQVMPRYVNEFAAICGMGTVTPDDLTDVTTNLMLGACLFRELTDDLHGNVALAAGAYNAGKNSLSLKEMRELRNISNMETLNYVAKYTYVRSEVDAIIASDPPTYDVKFKVPAVLVQKPAEASLVSITTTSTTTTNTMAKPPVKAKKKTK
jgi:hypothetical protein